MVGLSMKRGVCTRHQINRMTPVEVTEFWRIVRRRRVFSRVLRLILAVFGEIACRGRFVVMCRVYLHILVADGGLERRLRRGGS